MNNLKIIQDFHKKRNLKKYDLYLIYNNFLFMKKRNNFPEKMILNLIYKKIIVFKVKKLIKLSL